MNMFPQVRLQLIPAKIDIQVQRGSLEMEQKPADLEIEQPKAQVTMERKPPQLTIDQTKAREDVGYKSVARATEDAATEGEQAVLEGIARRGQERQELLQIQNGGNAIAAIAKNNRQHIKQFGIGWIPSSNSVEISYNPGELNISIEAQKPIINSKINKPEMTFTPSKVNIQMAQYPSLEIDFENLKFVGINYEQYI